VDGPGSGRRRWWRKSGWENYKGAGLAVQWVDNRRAAARDLAARPAIARLFRGFEPKHRPDPRRTSYRREVVSKQPLVDAERLLRDFPAGRGLSAGPCPTEDVKAVSWPA